MPLDVGAALTRKIGPFPAWVYGALIALLAAGYYYVSGRSNGTPASDSLAAPNAADSGAGIQDETGTVPVVSGGSVPTTGGTSAPTDNLAWFTAASNFLVAANFDTASVTNALNKYLQGEQLTLTERAMVNMAVARYGVPPEGVPVSPGATPTTPPFPTVPGGLPRKGYPNPRPRPMPMVRTLDA